MFELHSRYLFRLRSKSNNDIDAVPAPEKRDGVTDASLVLEGRKVRVLKFYLPGETLETLITNDFNLGKELFRQLYFPRWPAEESYRLIKEKVGLTDFRGHSENSVMQEFRISMLLTDLTLAINKETDGIIGASINQKGNKNQYMTNKNELVGCLSRRLPEYMDADTPREKFSIITNHRYIRLCPIPQGTG